MTPNTLLPTLGDRLIKARRIAKVSQNDVAKALKISPRTVGRYEDDDTEPSIDIIRRWAAYCGVPFVWLAIGELPSEEGDIGTVTIRELDQLAFDLVMPTAA